MRRHLSGAGDSASLRATADPGQGRHPTRKRGTATAPAQQLEAIIENALLPDKFDNARAVLHAMRPMTPQDGFTARVVLDDNDPHAADVHRVLNAAASIGAVRHTDGGEYHVRSELFEFLSMVAKKAFESDKRHVNMAELEKIVGVALLPDVGANAQVVLDHMHPITEDRGFTAEVHLDEIEPDKKRIVRGALNAGATLQVVQRVGTAAASYYIHGDFYRAVARIRARTIVGGYGNARLAGPGSASHSGVVDGGSLSGQQAALPPAGTKGSGSAGVPSLIHQPQPNAEPPQPPAESAAQAFAAHPIGSEAEIRDAFVETLVKAIGVDYEQYVRIPQGAYASAVAASEAFSLARRTNVLLDEELAIRYDMARSALLNSKNRMQRDLDPEDSRALESAGKDVEDNLPVLMLLPGAPYEQVLQTLIANLEAANGEGELSSQDAALYASAVNLRNCLFTGHRNSDQGWRAFEHALKAQAASVHSNLHGAGGRHLNS